MQLQFGSQFFKSIVFLDLIVLFFGLYTSLVEKPNRLRSKLRKQGISGPPPTIHLGNMRVLKKAQPPNANSLSFEFPDSHNCASAIFPLFEKWREQYGQMFMFSLGNMQILSVNQPGIVRDITTFTSLDLGKPSYQLKQLGPLLGRGILTSNGTIWAHQRKILAPELYMEKVKVYNVLSLLDVDIYIGIITYNKFFTCSPKRMMRIISESSISLLNLWSSRIEAEGGVADIKIDEYMRTFSGDVISKACFGSNYSNGGEIFLKFRALQEILSWKNRFKEVPGMRYLPTANRETWALEKEVKSLILQVMKERKGTNFGKDLLQVLLEGAEKSNLTKKAMDCFIGDNCKNIYLAGYETTAVSATWCLMLLASNQNWKDRVRAEVLQICKGRIPDYDMLGKMKQLTMVIDESLRLYPPVTLVQGHEVWEC